MWRFLLIQDKTKKAQKASEIVVFCRWYLENRLQKTRKGQVGLLLTRLLGEALVPGLLVGSLLQNLYLLLLLLLHLLLVIVIGGVGVSVNGVTSATSY